MRSLTGLTIAIIIFSTLFSGRPHLGDPFAPARLDEGDTVMPAGRKIFDAYCRNCHKDSGIAQAPDATILSTMTPKSIVAALRAGKMRLQASALNDSEKTQVAEWITQSLIVNEEMPKDAFTQFKLSTGKNDYSGWGGNLEGTGFRTLTQTGINTLNLSSLHFKWAFAFAGATVVRSKPAVVGDWLIVGGQFGELYALNKKTGKIGWKFAASAAIRGAIVIEEKGEKVTAYFADFSTNVYAINARNGKLIWDKRAGFDQQSSVTGSVAIYNGYVYVPISSIEVAMAANGNYSCCTSSGGVVALSSATGQEIWRHRVLPTARVTGKKKNGGLFFGPSGAPVWCSPTVDAKRGLLYLGTGENYSMPSSGSSDAIQALDLKTGRLVWNFQSTKNDIYNLACPYFNNCPWKPGPDLDFGMAPLLVKRPDGKDILVAGQKAGLVFALSPSTGKVIWKRRIGKGGALGGVHWGMAADAQHVYAANADNLAGLDLSDTSIKPSPGLYALDLSTGNIAWKAGSPDCMDKSQCFDCNSAAPAVIPGIVFAGGLGGHIRAYSSKDGKLLWDFNTIQNYETTDGLKGKGGAIDGPAPVMSGGFLYVNSGYGMFGEAPGNVIICFSVEPDKH